MRRQKYTAKKYKELVSSILTFVTDGEDMLLTDLKTIMKLKELANDKEKACEVLTILFRGCDEMPNKCIIDGIIDDFKNDYYDRPYSEYVKEDSNVTSYVKHAIEIDKDMPAGFINSPEVCKELEKLCM